MPNETQQAINWALNQIDESNNPITKETCHSLVDKVREYFNTNNIPYNTFSYDDLLPFLQ